MNSLQSAVDALDIEGKNGLYYKFEQFCHNNGHNVLTVLESLTVFPAKAQEIAAFFQDDAIRHSYDLLMHKVVAVVESISWDMQKDFMQFLPWDVRSCVRHMMCVKTDKESFLNLQLLEAHNKLHTLPLDKSTVLLIFTPLLYPTDIQAIQKLWRQLHEATKQKLAPFVLPEYETILTHSD